MFRLDMALKFGIYGLNVDNIWTKYELNKVLNVCHVRLNRTSRLKYKSLLQNSFSIRPHDH